MQKLRVISKGHKQIVILYGTEYELIFEAPKQETKKAKKVTKKSKAKAEEKAE